MTAFPTVLAVAGLVAGTAVGAVYFFLLYRTAQLQATAAAVTALVPLYLLRIGLAVATFWGLAQFGAWPLIAGLAGFLLARLAAQRLVAGR